MATDHKTTYCRICESLCGMVAEVQEDRLVALRADKDHPLSAGFACQKGIAFTERRADLTASYQLFLLDPNGVKVELNFAASEAAGRKAELMRADLA